MAEKNHSLHDLKIDRTQGPPANNRGVLGIILLLFLIASAVAWYMLREQTIRVTTVLAREESTTGGAMDRTVLNASGYVTARREATVSSKITAKVTEVLVEEGMKVKEGQTLARLDDTNLQTGLKLAQAQLEATKAALHETQVRIRESEITLRRTQDLARNSISAQADLDRAEAETDSLKARLVQQQSQVKVAEQQLATWLQQIEDTIIRAPFAGVVTSKDAQPGEMISPVSAGGGFTRTGICTIVDMSSLEVEVDVSESYINRVQPGQPVEAALDAYPDIKMPCKVIAIIPTANRQKSAVRVRVGFDELHPRVLPEMSIKIAFREPVASASENKDTKLVTIPRSAVQKQDGRDLVMVVQQGRAERRALTLGSSNGENVSVLSGLTPGERVAINWPAGLADGSKVVEKTP